jgi:putative ABC transport system permease protein
VLALQERIERTLAAIPGVTGVSATTGVPLTDSASQTTIGIPGAPGNTGNEERDRPLVDWMGVRAGYFDVMGMRVVEGRSFDPIRHEGTREALIDRSIARTFFPGGSALGAKIPFGGNNQFLTVVGVVDQARLYDVHQDGRPQMYVRAEDAGFRSLVYVLRSERDLAGLVPDVRTAVRGIDTRLAVANVRSMPEIVGDALRQQRISAVLITGFALGALLLAGMGLFGVVSGSVTRRRHELAVRLAVGADHGRLLRLVLREGAVLVGIGILLGVPGVYFAGTVLRGVLVGVSPTDPATLVTVTLGLGLVAMVACYLPARRVLGIDPAQSLRQE